MTKIQVDSNGKAIMLGGKALVASEGGVTPTGTLSITQNGTYDVTNYASADVNVSGGGYTILTTTDIELEDTGEGSGYFDGGLLDGTLFYLILNNNTPVSFYTKADADDMLVANMCIDYNNEPLTFSYVLDTISYDGSTFTVTCIGRYYGGSYAFFTLTANF